MNDLVSGKSGPLGAISKYFAGPVKDELGAGIQASFGVVTFKGKVWGLQYRNEKKLLMRKDGDGPVAGIEVVIVKTPEHLSKVYYDSGYQEGNSAPPDCFSNDGIKPDNSARKKQNPVCATCPKNAWGSAVAQQGGRASSGKACQDRKRLAIVPLDDLQNEPMGGPMLLRVPPASLQDLALYGSALTKYGYPPCAVATRISFNAKEAYPKFAFQAIRVLTDDEAQQILEIQKRPIIDRILAETGDNTEATEERGSSPFEEEPRKQNGGNGQSSEPQIRTNPEDRKEEPRMGDDYPTQEAPIAGLDDLLQKLIPST